MKIPGIETSCKDGKTFHEREKIAESFGRGESGNSAGNDTKKLLFLRLLNDLLINY